MNAMLDQLCPDDPTTVARKENIDSNSVEIPQIVGDDKSK